MRLLTNSRFKNVLAKKLRFTDGLLILYIAKHDTGHPRLGISVGKYCGGAVGRNRLKRLLREAFRLNQDKIPASYDYLLMFSPKWLENFNKNTTPKNALKKLNFQQLSDSFLALIAQSGVKYSN